MTERSLEEKAFSRYLVEGDFGMDISTGFPLILRDNRTQEYTRLCEVWGIFHEWGSVWSRDLRALTQDEFEHLKRRMNSID